jgi:hypothetical protein
MLTPPKTSMWDVYELNYMVTCTISENCISQASGRLRYNCGVSCIFCYILFILVSASCGLLRTSCTVDAILVYTMTEPRQLLEGSSEIKHKTYVKIFILVLRTGTVESSSSQMRPCSLETPTNSWGHLHSHCHRMVSCFCLLLWGWRRFVPPKRQAFTKLLAVIYEITVLFIVVAPRGMNMWRELYWAEWIYVNTELSIVCNLSSCPCNRPWRPIGFWDVKDPTLSRQSAHS